MSLGFCARYILFQLCALSIVISRTVLNGNVCLKLNFAFDDDDDDKVLSVLDFKTVLTNPRLYLSFPDMDEPVCKRCAW